MKWSERKLNSQPNCLMLIDYCCEFELKNTPIQTMMCGTKESSNQYQSKHKQ